MPNYNNAKYLPACLDSVVSQTFADFECLVVDDCSTDKSAAVISGYAARDNRIKLYKTPKNSGVGAVRNLGLDTARGEYIMFLDSDDVLNGAALENLYRVATSLPADIVAGQFSKVPDAFKIPAEINPMINFSFEYFDECQDFAAAMPGIDLVVVWGKLFHRRVLDGIRFRTDIYPYEDVEFMMRLYPRAPGGAVSHTQALYYRQSDTSVIREKNRDVSGDVIKAMSSLTQFMANRRKNEIPLPYVLFLKKYCYEFSRNFIVRTKNKMSSHNKKSLKLQLLNMSAFVRAAYGANLWRDLDASSREKWGLRLFSLGFIGWGGVCLTRKWDK
jgi:glycosyltransferase involved in cell wall biosynthesis